MDINWFPGLHKYEHRKTVFFVNGLVKLWNVFKIIMPLDSLSLSLALCYICQHVKSAGILRL